MLGALKNGRMLTQGAVRSLTVLSMIFACGACVPVMSVPPASPVSPDRPNEFGTMVVYANSGFHSVPNPILPAFSYRRHFIEMNEVGAHLSLVTYTTTYLSKTLTGPTYDLLSFGAASPKSATFMTLVAGGYYRRYFVNHERVQFGGEVAMGLVYGELSVPVAVRLNRFIWLTTKPAIAVPGDFFGPKYRLPAGLGIELDGGRIDIEAGYGGPWGVNYIGGGFARSW